jgi:proteasome lid subunit RPN8/RPN11
VEESGLQVSPPDSFLGRAGGTQIAINVDDDLSFKLGALGAFQANGPSYVKGVVAKPVGDREWRAELPVGDTDSVFHTVAIPVPPQRVSTLILHSHPSGDPLPSPEDVLGDLRYLSFKEAGQL